jgi:hypothetical protein
MINGGTLRNYVGLAVRAKKLQRTDYGYICFFLTTYSYVGVR